jgi:hypothetical protein
MLLIYGTRDGPDSNLGRDSSHPDTILVIFLSPSRHILGKHATTASFPIYSNSVFFNHPIIRCYTECFTTLCHIIPEVIPSEKCNESMQNHVQPLSVIPCYNKRVFHNQIVVNTLAQKSITAENRSDAADLTFSTQNGLRNNLLKLCHKFVKHLV